MTASEKCRQGKFASCRRELDTKCSKIDNFRIISSKINWQFRLRAAARWQLTLKWHRKEFPHGWAGLWSQVDMTAQQVPRANFANKSRPAEHGMPRTAQSGLGGFEESDDTPKCHRTCPQRPQNGEVCLEVVAKNCFRQNEFAAKRAALGCVRRRLWPARWRIQIKRTRECVMPTHRPRSAWTHSRPTLRRCIARHCRC